MNNKTHKTVRVLATMHTDLYIDINVPIDTDKDDIWQFIRGGNVDGGDMSTDYDSGDWTWEEPIYDYEFNPDAPDLLTEFLQS